MIGGIHHATFLVGDIQRALLFYCDLLELPVDPARPDLGFPGAWLQVGDQQIHLMELPDPYAGCERPSHGGRDRHVALTVGDLDELAKRLESAGLTYTLSRSGRKALFCRDPDGNALEFIEKQ